MAGALRLNDRGTAVGALQRALNDRAEARFYPPLMVDSELGISTWRAFVALGFALGFTDETLAGHEISATAQRLIADPSKREQGQLDRARRRAPKLHLRTIALDGTPTFWGLAKPLVRAREHGWSGQLVSSDRRKGVAERFGKMSQTSLFDCFTRSRQLHRCPGDCHGNCNPANPPGASSHELCSDGVKFAGPVGRKLHWWELGMDCSESAQLVDVLKGLGYKARRPYTNPRERHHVNFTVSPGAVLPITGPHATPAATTAAVAVHLPRVRSGHFTGPDVSVDQRNVDWRKVKAAGHAFAIAKVTDGLNTPDPTFGRQRWKEMKDAGLIRGAYHFGRPQPGRDPRDEVHEFLRHLDAAGGLQVGDLRPALDLEKYGSKGRLSPRKTLEWARGWVDEFRAQVGMRPLIYTGVFWRETMGNPGDDLDCRLWLAAYVPKSKVKGDIPAAWKAHGFTFWQHTSTGRCAGVTGDCDLNRFAGDAALMKKLLVTS